MIALVLMFAVGCSHSSSDIKVELQNRYDQMDKAMQERNADKLAGFMADDFMAHLQGGKALNRSQMLTSMGDQFKEATSITSTSTVDTAENKGERAEATVTAKQQVVYKDAHDKVHTIEITSTSHDTWVWRPQEKAGPSGVPVAEGGWRLIGYAEVNHTRTEDGNPQPAPSSNSKS